MRLALLALTLTACAQSDELPGDTAADTDETVDTDRTVDPDSPSFATTVYAPYLEEACAGCHIENGYIHPPITAEASHLVGVASFDGMHYVTAGDLAESLLWFKVNGRQAEVGDRGDQMPPDDGDRLSAPAIAAIEAWILGGAAP